MSKDKLFDIPLCMLCLIKSLSTYDIDYIFAIYADNPDISPTAFKDFIFHDNPEFYNKLVKLNLIDYGE